MSHWPRTPTPAALRADLSAEIVRGALARPDLVPVDVDVVSIDHVDADGLISLALMVVEGLDAAYGPLLVEAARAGDFDVVTDRRAARVAFALRGLLDGEQAAGGTARASGVGDVMELYAAAAGEAMDLVPALAENPDRYERLWHREDAAYHASVRALHDGWATIEEISDLDLALVRVDLAHAEAAAAWGTAPLHRAAIHNATDCLRIVTLAGDRMELRYRYESWVRLGDHRPRPRPRVDLAPLAAELDTWEASGAPWVFDGAGSVTGALHLAGNGGSSVDAARFVDAVCRRLTVADRGPAAWDPYAEGKA